MPTDLIRGRRLQPDSPPLRRVLFATNMWPEERRPYYGSFVASQARSLRDASVEVDIVYVRGYLGAAAYARALAELPRRARARRYDLVHMHYGHTALAGVGVRGLPIVTSFCGEDLLGAPRERGDTRKSRAEVAVFRQLARVATATITKSEEMAAVLPAAVRARNHVLPNGVDLDRFAPRPRAAARAALGWPEEGRVMLFLGNPDDPRKNVKLARAAAERVERERADVRLHVAWAVAPYRVPTLMNAADCLVFTSRSEGSPNVVKEAMASALPIVATPVGDVRDRLGGVEGCFVREPLPEEFAEALMKALAAGRAPAAREAVAPLGLERVASRLLEIYDEAEAAQRSAARA